MIGLLLDGTEPQVPVEMGRNRREGFVAFLAAESANDPDVHLADLPDRTAPDQFDHPAVVAAGMNLRPDLGHPPGFARQFGHHPRLGDGPGQRLFAVEMPPAAQGRDARHGVSVVRGGHHDGIEILLVHQPPKVPVGLRIGKFLRHRGDAICVHVAESRDVGDVLEVADAVARLPARTNESDIQPVIGGHGALGARICGAAAQRPAAAAVVFATKRRRFIGVVFIGITVS